MKTPIRATVWRPGEEASCKLDLNVDDMTKVLEALAAHGYIILKKATRVKARWDGMVQDWSNHRVESPDACNEQSCQLTIRIQ